MRNIFRRKSAFQVNVPKITEEPLTPTKSLLSEGKKINGIELTNLLSEKMFQKLKLIFQKNPRLQKYITLYKFSSLTSNYQEFRQQTLKSQITKGLDLVLKFEEMIFTNYDKFTNLNVENKNQDLMHLNQPRQDWNRVRIVNYTIRDIINSINKIASLKINENKNLAIYLISLLTSLDAIPPDCIPVIDFDDLIVNKDQVINNDPKCRSYLTAIPKLEAECKRTDEKISTFKHKYDDTTPDDQTAQFHAIIRSFYDIYNKETHLFKETPQDRIFHEFLAHPKIISLRLYQKFASNISPDSFNKFVNSIIELYNVTDEDDKIISYLLCSFAYLPTVADSISRSTETVESDDKNLNIDENELSKYIDLAFNVFITIDPTSVLMIISNFIDNEQKPIEEILSMLFKTLEMLTPQWKELLSFIVNYSIPKFLQEKLVSIRQSISDRI